MSLDELVIAVVALAAMVAGEVWRMSTPALVRDAPLLPRRCWSRASFAATSPTWSPTSPGSWRS